MNRETSELISRSWARVSGHRDELARIFYDRVFELDPRIEDLFAATEMDSQQGKFVVMMSEIVHLAHDPDAFEDILRASGARHREYGVVSRHYRTVGEAFLKALDEVTPGGLDDDSKGAWAEAYTLMAHLMQCGAEDASADRSSG